MKVMADTKKAEADAAYLIQQENQRKIIEIAKTNDSFVVCNADYSEKTAYIGGIQI